MLDEQGVAVQVISSEYSGGIYLCSGRLPSGAVVPFYAPERLPLGATVHIRIQPDANLTVVGA